MMELVVLWEHMVIEMRSTPAKRCHFADKISNRGPKQKQTRKRWESINIVAPNNACSAIALSMLVYLARGGNHDV